MYQPVPVLTEPLHPGAFIVSEREGYYSRDAGVIGPSQTVPVGTVLGRTANLALVTAAAAAAAGNAGDGAITLDPAAPVRGDAVDGVYTIEFLSAGATAEFNLIDPDGHVVGTGAVGTPFAGQLKFSIADDAAKHYAVGDRILVTVAVPINAIVYEALNLAAVDGSQVAAAIAIYPAVTGAGQTASVAVLVRDAEFRLSDIAFPAGVTAAQQAEVLVQLRKRGLIAR